MWHGVLFLVVRKIGRLAGLFNSTVFVYLRPSFCFQVARHGRAGYLKMVNHFLFRVRFAFGERILRFAIDL